MWDKDTPLQLLHTMPKVLSDEHLEKLQMLLEADKYKNQLVSGMDLCGSYAPFCDGCNKETKFPCATAYVKYMQEEGLDIKINNEVVDEQNESDLNNAEDKSFDEEQSKDESEAKSDRKIRIAIARKRTLL